MLNLVKKGFAREENPPQQTPFLDVRGEFSTGEILCVAIIVSYFVVKSNRRKLVENCRFCCCKLRAEVKTWGKGGKR
jgi:hypothetical protein